MQKTLKSALFATLAFATALFGSAESLRDRIAKDHRILGEEPWYGNSTRITFDFNGRRAWVAVPKGTPAAGLPWSWTMQWADAFVDRTGVPKLLVRGFHHVTIDLYDTRMNDEGVALAADFQKYLVGKLGFAPKARLIGPSWGGFFSAHYAAAHPENVARIYFDAPLMNLGGRGDISEKRIGPWAKMGIADEAFIDDPRMPVNLAAPIAKAGIPVLLLYGAADGVVPPRINCELFVNRFKAAGGDITVFRREGVEHHPHGFDPEQVDVIADFLAAGTAAARSLKVLMIGNSFSICVLRQAPAIAANLGLDLKVCSVYIGGCSLERHANNLAETEADPSKRQYYVTSNFGLEGSFGIPEMLAKDAWDVVTIQQASHCSPFAETFEPFAERLVAGIRRYAPTAEIRVQQTWSYTTLDSRVWSRQDGRGSWKHGDKTLRWSPSDMFEHLSANYSALAARYGFKIIPTGKAVQLFRERRPCTFVPPAEEVRRTYRTPADIPATDDVVGAMYFNKKGELSVDSIHLNRRGEYLQGLVWVGSLFDVDPTRVTYRPDFVSQEDAALFRSCAHDALGR